MVFPPEYITKEAGESHGLYRDSSKSILIRLWKILVGPEPNDKTYHGVVWRCDIYSPAWVRLWLRMGDSPADLCLYLRQGQADGSRQVFIFVVFVIVLVTARAFFYDGDSPLLWSAGRFSIKLLGIYQGLRSSNIILSFSSSLIFFYMTTEPENLMLELEKHKMSPVLRSSL